jgi:3D (Asp-Asp-Asp) domain-containing protein
MATYYTEWDDKYVHYPTFRITKSGKIPTVWKTIAADPDVLPIGTVVYIPELKELPNGGFFVVEDTGGKVIGKRIDIYVNDVRLAQKTEDVTIYIVGKEG